MNREYNSRVSSKNSERLLKNLKNTTGVYFFLPHPVVFTVTCRGINPMGSHPSEKIYESIFPPQILASNAKNHQNVQISICTGDGNPSLIPPLSRTSCLFGPASVCHHIKKIWTDATGHISPHIRKYNFSILTGWFTV